MRRGAARSACPRRRSSASRGAGSSRRRRSPSHPAPQRARRCGPEKAEVPLRLKSPSSPWPTASCSSTPGQPGPSTTGISPAGAATDSRLVSACASAMSIARLHCASSNRLVVEIAAAEAVIAGLAAAVLLGDDLDAKPDQRADVGSDEAVGADDVDHAPARRQRDADLRDARIAGARRSVDPLAQARPCRRTARGERIVGAVHCLVGSRGGGARARRSPDRAA